jgi:hypothetical protein
MDETMRVARYFATTGPTAFRLVCPPGATSLAVIGAMLPLTWKLECVYGGVIWRAAWRSGTNPLPDMVRHTYSKFVPTGQSIRAGRAAIIRECVDDMGKAISFCLSDRQPPA